MSVGETSAVLYNLSVHTQIPRVIWQKLSPEGSGQVLRGQVASSSICRGKVNSL